MISKPHILYSYRRCPYAMRARMALFVANVQCDVHEVDFKNKPEAMLAVSPKGTVPVLVCDGQEPVLEESLDIMLWALSGHDPHGWLADKDESLLLIAENDGAFKQSLDRYKYANRFPDEDCSNARTQGMMFLEKLNSLLVVNDGLGLTAIQTSLADIAIFPFVRQFSNVDKEWFDEQDYPALQAWLSRHTQSDFFKAIFGKQEQNPYLLLG